MLGPRSAMLTLYGDYIRHRGGEIGNCFWSQAAGPSHPERVTAVFGIAKVIEHLAETAAIAIDPAGAQLR